MSLEERALEILREHEEEEEEEEEDHGMSPRADLDVHDDRDSDGDDDALESKEHPESSLPLLVRPDEVRGPDVDDEDEDDEDDEDLYRLLEIRTRYTEPLKGSPYIKKHDDILEIEHMATVYYINKE